jgi:hypothetical protein
MSLLWWQSCRNCGDNQVETTSSPLYAAATESLVSDASATSTFEKMIQVAYTHSTVDTFTKELKDTEKLIKKDFEISSMPGPWRSAKSVIHTAMKLGISLVDDNGSYCGKTFLQNKIKEMKPGKEEVTNQQYIDKVLRLLMDIPEHLDAKTIHMEVKKMVFS